MSTGPDRAADDVLPHQRRARDQAEGGLPGVGLDVDDGQEADEELSAKGVEFLQPPTQRPYGVEALVRDDSGNWMVLVEPREHTPEDLDGVDLS